MPFNFGKRSLDTLKTVHPDLVKVCHRALQITKTDFMILEGIRSAKKQAVNVTNGASQTMNSRHLDNPRDRLDGIAYAIDFGAWVNAVYVNGDTPSEYKYYENIAAAFKQAAKELSIPIVWGGDWKTLKDGGHIELDRRAYP